MRAEQVHVGNESEAAHDTRRFDFFWMGEKFPTVLRPLTPPGLIAASPERDNQNDQFVALSKKQGQTAGLFPLALKLFVENAASGNGYEKFLMWQKGLDT